MKTIAFYISEYGFGHASRSVAIIRELLYRDASIKIIICHSFALNFLRESLPYEQVTIRAITTDIGYFLKENSIDPDKKKLQNNFDAFIKDWTKRIEREMNFLKENNVELVISDISPLPFEAASKLGIPSVGISNFTWYSAYEYLLDYKRLEPWKLAYEKMDYFYLLAANNERDLPCKKQFFSLFARKVQDN